MPDLRKILFGAKNKDYVDVTRLGAPSKRKAPFVFNPKLALQQKPVRLGAHKKMQILSASRQIALRGNPAKFRHRRNVAALRADFAGPARRQASAKSGLKRKKKRLKFRLKVVGAKKIKPLKPLPKIKGVKEKKPKSLDLFTKISRPSLKAIKPSKKPVMSIKAVGKPQKSPKVVLPRIEPLAGEITHFFDKIQVCVIKVQNSLKIGDHLHFKGNVTDFSQVLVSMQVDHKPVAVAKKGQEIGLKVKKDVRVGDKVFII